MSEFPVKNSTGLDSPKSVKRSRNDEGFGDFSREKTEWSRSAASHSKKGWNFAGTRAKKHTSLLGRDKKRRAKSLPKVGNNTRNSRSIQINYLHAGLSTPSPGQRGFKKLELETGTICSQASCQIPSLRTK